MTIQYRSKEVNKTGQCYFLLVDQERKIFSIQNNLRYDFRINTHYKDIKQFKDVLKFQGYKDISKVKTLNDLVKLNGDRIVRIPDIRLDRKYEIPFAYNHRYGDIVDVSGYNGYVVDIGAEV